MIVINYKKIFQMLPYKLYIIHACNININFEDEWYSDERAEIISELIKTDNYVNLSKVTKEQLQKTSLAFKQEQA